LLKYFKFFFILISFYSIAWAVANSKIALSGTANYDLSESASTKWLYQDVHRLMSYYSPKAKWWQDPNCIEPGGCVGIEQSVWVWANAAYAMATYELLSNDKKYQQLIKTVYSANWKYIYPRKYFDDDLWWAVALIQVYQVTKDKDALKKAILLVEYSNKHGQQNVCFGNGGLYWVLDKTEVGTIANMLYIVANAKLYQITGNNDYRQQANLTWNWYHKSGLLKPNYTVDDHYAVTNGKCAGSYSWPFTYNVGSLLAALGALAEINNDRSFIEYGKKVANHSMETYNKHGIITESCDDVRACARNGFLFKGIYAYNLAQFAVASKDQKFIEKVRKNLLNNMMTVHQVQTNTRTYGFNWSLPINNNHVDKLYNPADILSHLSVVYLDLANVLIAPSQFLIKSEVDSNTSLSLR
jgi:hypothetical protein